MSRSRSISLKEFFAAEGSRFSNADAAIIGPALEALAQDNLAKDKDLTAREIVDVARSRNSPLHAYFEWDDASAADLFRLGQAQTMMRSIRIKTPDGDIKPVARAFRVAAPAVAAPSRENRAFKALHGESALAAQLMTGAYADLRTWRGKYEPYRQIWDRFADAFAPVLNQIAECEAELAGIDPPELADAALAKLADMRGELLAASGPWAAWREQSGFLCEAIEDAQAALETARVLRHADCLTCGKSFVAVDPGNRICPACATRAGGAVASGALPGVMA